LRHDRLALLVYLQEEMFCDEFHLVDLRVFDNCKKVCENVDHVFNLAADMGGMGFIQSNHSVIFYNNTMISFNMMEAARQQNIKRCVCLSPCSPLILERQELVSYLAASSTFTCHLHAYFDSGFTCSER
jgi:nucleoside-diphosphate-sugar epimerase